MGSVSSVWDIFYLRFCSGASMAGPAAVGLCYLCWSLPVKMREAFEVEGSGQLKLPPTFSVRSLCGSDETAISGSQKKAHPLDERGGSLRVAADNTLGQCQGSLGEGSPTGRHLNRVGGFDLKLGADLRLLQELSPSPDCLKSRAFGIRGNELERQAYRVLLERRLDNPGQRADVSAQKGR